MSVEAIRRAIDFVENVFSGDDHSQVNRNDVLDGLYKAIEQAEKSVPAYSRWAKALHYPECWDIAAYPTIEDAIDAVSPVVIPDVMARAYHNAIGDGGVGADDLEDIERGLTASIAETSPPAQQMPQIWEHQGYDALMQQVEMLTAEVAKYKALAQQKPHYPDWSESETCETELWKTPLRPMSENLLVADGVIAFQRKVIANLRGQLERRSPPAQKKSLTDGEIARIGDEIKDFAPSWSAIDFARAIIKATGGAT